jgi:phosphatidylglycerophosphatase A
MICINGTMAALAAVSAVACVALGRFAERAFGKKDPGACTVDEWAGQAVALIALPLSDQASVLQWLVAAAVAFIAFRFFDIVKPPPARQMEKFPHGWGILLDDLVAGLYANIVAQVVLRLVLK